MEVEIQMDDELDNELFYYGEVCELFDETVEAEFSGFAEDDGEVLEVESEDEILNPLLLPTQQVRNMNNSKTEVVPVGWDINNWNVGGTHLNNTVSIQC